MSDQDWVFEVAADVLMWIKDMSSPQEALRFATKEYSLADVIEESVTKYHPKLKEIPRDHTLP